MISINNENIQQWRKWALWCFCFQVQFVTRNEIYFIKPNLKPIKLLLIEKMAIRNNYITAYQTYLQHFRQNLLFAPPSSYQVLSDFFGGKIRLIVPVVHHQTSSSNIIAMFFIMEQILVSLTQIMLTLLKQEE